MASRLSVRSISFLVFSLFFIGIPSGQLQAHVKNSWQQKAPLSVEDVLRIQQSAKPAMHELAKSILDSVPYKRTYASLLSDVEWKELDGDLMVQKLNRTKTMFGFWGLQQISWPITDSKEIVRRQGIIKKLVSDAPFKKKLDVILDEIKLAQDNVVSYWNPHDEINQLSKHLYYSSPLGSWTQSISDYLNRSQIALEGSATISVCMSAGLLAMVMGGSGIVNEGILSYGEHRDFSLWNGLIKGFKQPFKINSPYKDICKDLSGNQIDIHKVEAVMACGTGGDYYEIYSVQLPRIIAGVLAVATVGYLDYTQYCNIKGRIEHFAFLTMVNHALLMRTMHVANLFRSIEDLREVVQANKTVFGSDIVAALDFTKCSKTFQQLAILLKSETFNSGDSVGYSRGNVLLAHQLMQDVKKELIPLLQMVAQIDGYNAIAKLYKEQSKEHAPFCFVEFVQDEQPQLQCTQCWTPLLTTQKPALNNIDWHKGTHTKIVLTGPNGSGKSTVMKAISHAIILAQAWGVCPAQKATIRMFTGLRSSLSPREDLQHNLSTFMAEKKRIDGIHTFMINNKPEDCFFILLDEPFRGTVESEAAYRIDLFAKDIVPLNHCMMIMATHLEGPTLLPEETKGIFANYQLGLEEKTDGSFVRTFTLLPGFAEWWFKDALKRRRFINQLLQT